MKQTQNNRFALVAVLFLFILLEYLDQNEKSGAVISVIIVAVILLFLIVKIWKNRKNASGSDSSAEYRVRTAQARTERRLREQAKAPDGTEAPARGAQPQAQAGRPAVRVGFNEAGERAEEWKSLYEGGLITEEEYRERIRALSKKS